MTYCITEINNTQIDDAQKVDVVMSIYNSIEYSDAYLKTSEVCGNTIEMNQI